MWRERDMSDMTTAQRWAAEKDNLDQRAKANRALFEQQRDKADALERDALTWQPIETAPRDSTPILVTGCNGGRVILYAQFFEERADESFKGPGWLGCFEGMQMWLAEPTHWMPLPTPPEADTGGA